MEIQVGKVTHFYARIYVAVLKLTGDLTDGELVHIIGHTTDFVQRVKSMEIDHHLIQTVAPGTEVALKVLHPVRRGDLVFRVPKDEADQVILEVPNFIEADH